MPNERNKHQSNSQSFNNSELSKGFHLLTESSHTVKVNTPSVPPNSAHLYPRLAGSNWTSYLTQPRVILGRSGTAVRSTRQNPAPAQVDLDFGDSKVISRKHCEIRFSESRDRWELYVHSRNGVKLNHVMKKPCDKPNVLKTGALIEICSTSFIFFLPNNYIKPTTKDTDTSSVSTPENDDTSLDHDLEIALIQIFENYASLDTTEILQKLRKSYTKPVEKENILHLLVLSPRFQLAPNSISMSFKDSDSVKWILIPLTTNLLETDADKVFGNDDMSSTVPTSTVVNTPTATNTFQLEKGKKRILSLDSNDDMSIVSSPAGHDSQSFFMRSFSHCDNMSISTSANGVIPFDDTHNEALPAVNISLSRFFDENERWPAFRPTIESTNTENENKSRQSATQTPTMFRAMSIESMYCIWSNGAAFAGDAEDDEGSRPNKRLKSIDKDGENMHEDKRRDPHIDIYRDIRQRIVY